MCNADVKDNNFKNIDLTGFNNIDINLELFNIDLDLNRFQNIKLKGFKELI